MRFKAFPAAVLTRSWRRLIRTQTVPRHWFFPATLAANLNLIGTAFLYSTYFGGTANEIFVAAVTSTNPIAVDATNAYITGYTSSTNLPTTSPLQAANAGAQDLFIAKIADVTPAA